KPDNGDAADKKSPGDKTPPPDAAKKEEPKKEEKKKGKPEKVRDTRKASKFFQHAQAMADARNYEYAIECYVNGLKHDPDNLPKHEPPRDVPLRRKVPGGRPASFLESLKPATGDPVDKLLHVETLWSKDPLNLSRMLTVMEKAADANDTEHEYNIGE